MKKDELLNAIDKLKPALADKGLIEYSGLIVLGDGRLTAYGDDISVSVPFVSPVEAALPWQEFTKLIRKLEAAEIEMKQEENQIVITAGKTRAGFNVSELSAPPVKWVIEESGWQKLPDGFCGALGFCAFSTSADASLGILQCVYVHGNKVVSSDNFRITEFQLKSEAPEILVPRDVAVFLSKYDAKDVCIDSSGAAVHYKDASGVIFTQRAIADDFPMVEELFNVEGTEVEMPPEIEGALDRAGVLADERDGMNYVRLTVARGQVFVRGQCEKGWVEERVPTSYKGKPMSFVASPKHLVQILDRSRKAIVGENTMLFKGEGFRHVVCLIAEEEKIGG